MKVKARSGKLEQLLQIAETPIWDGDLISKSYTKELMKQELVGEMNGFNYITGEGIIILDALGFIKR